MDIQIIEKGGTPLNISDKMPNLKNLYLGGGWDVSPNPHSTGEYDLDFTLALVGADGKLISSNSIVYYGRLTWPEGLDPVRDKARCTIIHSKDNVTGVGEGDDEFCFIHLNKLEEVIQRVVVIVNIYDAVRRKQKFGDVQNAFCRLVDGDTEEEFARVKLRDEFPQNTGVVVGELYRFGPDWKFKTVALGVDGDITTIIRNFGLS